MNKFSDDFNLTGVTDRNDSYLIHDFVEAADKEIDRLAREVNRTQGFHDANLQTLADMRRARCKLKMEIDRLSRDVDRAVADCTRFRQYNSAHLSDAHTLRGTISKLRDNNKKVQMELDDAQDTVRLLRASNGKLSKDSARNSQAYSMARKREYVLCIRNKDLRMDRARVRALLAAARMTKVYDPEVKGLKDLIAKGRQINTALVEQVSNQREDIVRLQSLPTHHTIDCLREELGATRRDMDFLRAENKELHNNPPIMVRPNGEVVTVYHAYPSCSHKQRGVTCPHPFGCRT